MSSGADVRRQIPVDSADVARRAMTSERLTLIASVFLGLGIALSVPHAPVAAADDRPLQLGDWTTTTPFSGVRTSLAAVINRDVVYVLGGLSATADDFTLYNDVQFARLGNDGTIAAGSWRTTTSFTTPRSGLGAVVYNNIVYVVGGFAREGTRDDVQYATIQADGTFGEWTQDPNHLNIPRSNFRLEVFKTLSGSTYLAAIAGVGTIGNDTVHFDEIEVAPIRADGSIGAWKLCPFHLKGGRSAPATFVAERQLYVLGGWGDQIKDVFRDVQFAPIRDDGCLDPWNTGVYPLNIPVYGHTALLDERDGRLQVIVLGGNGGQGIYFAAAQIASVLKGGEPRTWTFDSHQFAPPRWGHAGVRYMDFIYVLGGSQRAAPGFLDDVQFAKLSPP